MRAFFSRRGAAATECAFVLPFLFILMLGAWEVGRIIEVQQLVTNATREAVRQAATGTMDYAQTKAVAEDYLKNAKVSTANLDVKVENITTGAGPSYNPSAAAQMDHLRVTVSLPYDNVRWILGSRITTVDNIAFRADWNSLKDNPVTIDTSIPGNS